MENNNKTFLDILRKGTPEATERNNALTQKIIQHSANRKLANGLSIQNAAEIAKEQEATAKRLNEQEKAKQALNHLIEIDEQQGIKTDRMLTAVNRFTESLQYANSTEEAFSRLSPEDRLVLTAYPTLYSTALRNANEANKAYLNKDVESRSIMDVLRENRTASDIERKVSTKNMYLKMADEHPELRDYFLGKAKENEFDINNQAFLASEDGQQYLSATSSSNRAMDSFESESFLGFTVGLIFIGFIISFISKTKK